MDGESTGLDHRDGARYDPMGDTWLALIVRAGAVMRRFDLRTTSLDTRPDKRDGIEEQTSSDQ